jgi:hypothetical protein
MVLAGIHKKRLDARLRGHDEWVSDAHLCGATLGDDLYGPVGTRGHT